jgi:hypothetical protein
MRFARRGYRLRRTIGPTGEIATGEDDALGFLPRLLIVRDDEQCLVLAGEPWQRGVRWCEPVASDGEARLVVEKASNARRSFLRGRMGQP